MAASANKPNVVVILADDLGSGDLSCYGATKIKAPNIDRLAQEGRRFTQAYTLSSVCSPTRASTENPLFSQVSMSAAEVLAAGVTPAAAQSSRSISSRKIFVRILTAAGRSASMPRSRLATGRPQQTDGAFQEFFVNPKGNVIFKIKLADGTVKLLGSVPLQEDDHAYLESIGIKLP